LHHPGDLPLPTQLAAWLALQEYFGPRITCTQMDVIYFAHWANVYFTLFKMAVSNQKTKMFYSPAAIVSTADQVGGC